MTQTAVAPDMAKDAQKIASPIALPTAPAFGASISYVARRGSVMLYLPQIAGAGDYRAFVLNDGVSVADDSGAERVNGAVISCAGLKQTNQCDQSEAITSFGPNIRVPDCSADPRALNIAKSPLRELQLENVSGRVTVVVEALDALCPFPGAYGAHHTDIHCYYDGMATQSATYQGRSVDWRACPDTFPVRSESEIRADYGSLILNGQAPATAAEGKSPWETLGLPAPARSPHVLAREVIEVEAIDPTVRPAEFGDQDFFESFSDPSDQPQLVTGDDLVPSNFEVQGPRLYQTKQLDLYSYGDLDPQWFVSNGTLRSVLADWDQEIMASKIMYPRRAFALPSAADRFIHVTFETPADASQRRYWWFHACGSNEAGQTMIDGKLAPRSGIVPQPGFMDPLDGDTVSTTGWNCLQIVPRGGGYERQSGAPYAGGVARPETDLRIVINPFLPGLTHPADVTDGVFNVSPGMIPDSDPTLDGSWVRQWNAQKQVDGVMLDDKMYVEERVHFDVFFNRGRIVVYADGVQKVCNDFPKHELSMAEAAIGVGHVLYHSSAEHGEFLREDWLRTGQSYYLHDTPFLDQRSFDNFGVRQNVALPTGFQEGQCYTAAH